MIRMKLMDETDNICVPAGTLLFWEIGQSKVGGGGEICPGMYVCILIGCGKDNIREKGVTVTLVPIVALEDRENSDL